MFKRSETIAKDGRSFGLFIVLILLAIAWWISDSMVFYQWSLVVILSLYTFIYHRSISSLKQTVKKRRGNIFFYRRYKLTFMDWCFWCFMVYHSLGIWNQSLDPSWSIALFCACLLFSVVARSCIPFRFKIKCGKEYVVSKETEDRFDTWVLFKVFAHQQNGVLDYLGPVYVDKTGQDNFFATLQAEGVTFMQHRVMEWSNTWANLKWAMLSAVGLYFLAFVMPDIAEMMFPVGWDTTKFGDKFYRTESMQAFAVFGFMFLFGIPLALMAMAKCFAAIVTAIQGGRASILFLPDKVILSHYDKYSHTNKTLSISNLRHIKSPPKGDPSWDLDTSVQLIDKNGELVELFNWSLGSVPLINHLVQIGVPVLCFDYKKEQQEKWNKEREQS